MAVIKRELPKVIIDGKVLPKEILENAAKVHLIKEANSIDRCIVTYHGFNIQIGDIKAKELEIAGKKYRLNLEEIKEESDKDGKENL